MRLWRIAPPAELALGQEFTTERLGATGIVGRKLGEGGQGAVHLCDVGGRQLALKWYHPDTVARDARLRERIERLIARGPPDKRFLFPLDLAQIPGRREFGYVMPIVSPDRRPFSDLRERPPQRLELPLELRATACYEIAEAFGQLHAGGLSYQDLNFGSFFIDPVRGGMLICDPDNINIDELGGDVMLGTPKFMAPEIVRGEAMPSVRTDLYSMAVLFFYALFGRHPLEGRAVPRPCPEEGRLRFYGADPLFVFDPVTDANGPTEADARWLEARWSAMPAGLRDLFTRSFTEGLWNPDARVVETDWRAAMARLRDAIAACPGCGFEIPIDAGPAASARPSCPACGGAVPRPTRLTLERWLVSMMPAHQLYPHHVDAEARIGLRDSVATVDAHPTDATVLGLRNLSAAPWQGRTGEGRPVTVVPGRTVRILDGLGIDFGRREGLVAGADPPGAGDAA